MTVKYNQETVELEKYTEPFSLYIGAQTKGWDTVREIKVNELTVKFNKNGELIVVDLEQESPEEITFETFYQNKQNRIKSFLRMVLLSSIGAHCTKETKKEDE